MFRHLAGTFVAPHRSTRGSVRRRATSALLPGGSHRGDPRRTARARCPERPAKHDLAQLPPLQRLDFAPPARRRVAQSRPRTRQGAHRLTTSTPRSTSLFARRHTRKPVQGIVVHWPWLRTRLVAAASTFPRRPHKGRRAGFASPSRSGGQASFSDPDGRRILTGRDDDVSMIGAAPRPAPVVATVAVGSNLDLVPAPLHLDDQSLEDS